MYILFCPACKSVCLGVCQHPVNSQTHILSHTHTPLLAFFLPTLPICLPTSTAFKLVEKTQRIVCFQYSPGMSDASCSLSGVGSYPRVIH